MSRRTENTLILVFAVAGFTHGCLLILRDIYAAVIDQDPGPLDLQPLHAGRMYSWSVDQTLT